MIVAFIGNDGSGKTTIAKKLVNILRELGLNVTYKHEYDYTIIKSLFKLIGVKKIESERKNMLVKKKKSWKYYIWPFLVYLDACLSYYYFKFFKKKEMVILDRFFFDHYMSFKYLGNLTKFSEWLYLHSPKPDIIFLLWVKPEIAFFRKKATHRYGLNFYIHQTREYLKLSKDQGIKDINTNKTIKDTINEIIKALPTDVLAFLLKRGMQNRVLFSVIEKNEITPLCQLKIKFMKMRKKLEKTFAFIENFFKENKVTSYALIKTSFQYGWIGNDIDILVSKNELNKIVNRIKKINAPNIILKKRFMEEGKVDIEVLEGIPIDLHSYVGWRNVVFFSPDEILNHNYLVKKENNIYFVNEKVNSIIIMITHVFEKGFITLNEYKFLTKWFDESFLHDNFPHLYNLLKIYVSWIKKALIEKRSRSYPLFIPIDIILRCYLKLFFYSKNNTNIIIWKIKAFIRDILVMIFWRVRFFIKNKLPFEVNING